MCSKAGLLTRIGNYELQQGYLGKGTFAVVRLGVHEPTKTNVAVKIVDKADFEENFHEIPILRHLDHPYIIDLIEVLETKDMFCIVTEYACKGDMLTYLQEHGKMSEPDACHAFAQTLSAVKVSGDIQLIVLSAAQYSISNIRFLSCYKTLSDHNTKKIYNIT